ncbi:MAG: hypothetical protein M1826_000580 [Phylliscum demangeonii]|nr:MAG: hypothetical protein M1826_000580 [Phylliscum demangeonii]
MAGKLFEYPFDTIKVRLQSQPDTRPLRYQGPLDCIRQSFREGGMRGLYRGVSAPLVGAAIETSSLFFSYRIAKELLQSTFYPSAPLPFSGLLVAGAASGALTSLVLTPIELVKCQMQVPPGPLPSPRAQMGPLAIIRSIHRHHGLPGFWRGQMGTLVRETGGSTAWFGSYEAMSAFFRSRSRSRSRSESRSAGPLALHQQLAAGAVAGVSYSFLFFPADTIKSCLQTDDLAAPASTAAPPRTFRRVGLALWRQHGLSGLYRGCGITVARAVPSSAIIFALYESLKERFA